LLCLAETKHILANATAISKEIERAKQAKQAGFYDYLAKPVDINQLNKLLDQLRSL